MGTGKLISWLCAVLDYLVMAACVFLIVMLLVSN